MNEPLTPDRVMALLPALGQMAEAAQRGPLDADDLRLLQLGLGLDEPWATDELRRWADILTAAQQPGRQDMATRALVLRGVPEDAAARATGLAAVGAPLAATPVAPVVASETAPLAAPPPAPPPTPGPGARRRSFPVAAAAGPPGPAAGRRPGSLVPEPQQRLDAPDGRGPHRGSHASRRRPPDPGGGPYHRCPVPLAAGRRRPHRRAAGRRAHGGLARRRANSGGGRAAHGDRSCDRDPRCGITNADSPHPHPAPPLNPDGSGGGVSAGVGQTFGPLWGDLNLHAATGCPTTPEKAIITAYTPFERGYMIWRQDNRQIYAVYSDGTWEAFPDTWKDGDPAYSCTDTNTPNRTPPTPQRGIGKAWCTQPGVRAKLGNALADENGNLRAVQDFERGVGFGIGERDPAVFILENDTRRWSAG